MARTKKDNAGQLRRALKERDEARAFQTATEEILTAISRSTSDAKPVFDAIVRNVPRLFDTRYVAVFLIKGEELHLAAAKADAAFQRRHGARFRRFQESFPQRIHWGGFTGKVLRSGKVSQIGPIIGNPKATPQAVQLAREFGYNTMLVAPLMRDGRAIGAIGTTRPGVKLFSAKDLALFKAFAAQAVIAIENARLFNETKEALERQTATAEILKVISASPTSTQPVFDSIVNNCGILFKDSRVALWLISEGRLLPRASTGYMPGPMPLDRESVVGACALEARTLHLADLRSGAEQHPRIKQLGLKHGYLSGVFAPLLREGHAIGAISLLRRELGAFSDREVALLGTFADQAVIAIENARLFNETKEALEQQTTTASVLRVIAGSPTDLKPVMNAVVEKAARLLEADHALIGQADGENIHWLAAYGCPVPDGARSITRELPSGRAILDLQTTQIEDIGQIERDSLLERSYGSFGVRTICATPLIREGRAIGVILLRRTEVRPFTEKQMSLLRTFADQAVIATENARLFNETKEALERQTATGEVLQVISRSAFDLQTALDTLVQSVARLCQADHAWVFRREGDVYRWAASFGHSAEEHARIKAYMVKQAVLPSRGSLVGRTALEGRPVQIVDVLADPEYQWSEAQEVGHYRTTFGVPLVRDDTPIGVLCLTRAQVRPFSESQMHLCQIFADQAVIAIENARLFNETKEALEQQTATSELLKIIGRSTFDLGPVFETLAKNTVRLCEAERAFIFRFDGELLRVVATHNVPPDFRAWVEKNPIAPGRHSSTARSALERRTIHIHDVMADPEYTYGAKHVDPIRTVLTVPMLRAGELLGVLLTYRHEVLPFTDSQIALLETFADQAAIAIQNARLFNETKEALERQTATAEILKVISASPSDVQPVFDAVAVNAARVCGVDDVAILRTEGADLRRVAHYGSVPVTPDSLVPVPSGSVNERVLSEHRTLHIPDTLAPSFTREFPGSQFPGMGVRALLATPLVHDGVAVGVIHLRRSEPRPFTEKQIAMLETFADQAVIAIENVRLFKELQERTDALSKSVNQLTALGEVGQAISSMLELDEVLRTIVRRAVELSGMDAGSIYEFEARDQRFHLRAAQNVAEDILDVYRKSPIRLGEGSIGTAGARREPVMVQDVLDDRYRSRAREALIKSGVRALLAVPLLREELLLGALVVSRKSPGPFAREVIDLLNTFATQSAVAIQNARLFREIAEKSRELEEASRHKSQFLASMSHELRTPLNAILGFNEMILGQVYGEVPPDMKEPLEDIQKSGKHLLRLINNVLDLAKIEAGRMELALADYSVRDTVESVRSTLRPLAEAKGLELVVNVPADIPLAYGDGGRLTQCLMNLAGNSLKFTKQGKVEIAVEAENGCLRWRVSDTGIGIPPDKIPTLFSEFKQTDATIASEYGGTGLGLSITKKFVEMHGGRIWVESEPGKGSVFTLEVPLRVTAPA
jgi:GAF domain-containing protein/anti-sigma regulatory factor (Ser/Thr protein kinase)